MLIGGSLNGLNGYDRSTALVHDYQIIEGLESLIRSAALRTVKEVRAGLSGLSEANSENEFDQMLDDSIMANALEGLGYGNIAPMSAADFDRRLLTELTGGGLSGIFSKLKKSIKKIARSPLKLHKKIRKSVSKVARKMKPFVKKYGAAIAAVVALYYGGPTAMAAVKKAWSKYQAKKAAAAVEGGMMGPPPPEGYGNDMMGPPAPEGYGIGAIGNLAVNAAAIEKGASVLKKQMEASGTPMNSPGAWDFLKGVVKGQLLKRQAKMKREQVKIQQRVTGTYGPPTPPKSNNMLPLLAVGVGAGAIFMMTKS